DHLGAALGVAAGDDDVRALGGERFGDGPPDVAGRPGHQGLLVLQPLGHGGSFPSCDPYAATLRGRKWTSKSNHRPAERTARKAPMPWSNAARRWMERPVASRIVTPPWIPASSEAACWSTSRSSGRCPLACMARIPAANDSCHVSSSPTTI